MIFFGNRPSVIRQYTSKGYSYKKAIGLEELPDFDDPPWRKFPQNSPIAWIQHVVTRDLAAGTLWALDFVFSADDSHVCQTVIVARLKDGGSNALAGQFAGLELGNGLMLARRGSCIYVFFNLLGSPHRSCLLEPAEKIRCLVGLERILEGDVEAGAAALQSIEGNAAGHTIFMVIVTVLLLGLALLYVLFVLALWRHGHSFVPLVGIALIGGAFMLWATRDFARQKERVRKYVQGRRRRS